MSSFPDILREERTAVGWSRSTLARKSGFDPSYVSRLESGVRQPTIKAVRKIGKALGIPNDSDQMQRLINAAGYVEGDDAIVPKWDSVRMLHDYLGDKRTPSFIRNAVDAAVKNIILALNDARYEGGSRGTPSEPTGDRQPAAPDRMDQEGLEHLRRVQGDHFPHHRDVAGQPILSGVDAGRNASG